MTMTQLPRELWALIFAHKKRAAFAEHLGRIHGAAVFDPWGHRFLFASGSHRWLLRYSYFENYPYAMVHEILYFWRDIKMLDVDLFVWPSTDDRKK